MYGIAIQGEKSALDQVRREYPVATRSGLTVIDRPLRHGEVLECQAICAALGVSTSVRRCN